MVDVTYQSLPGCSRLVWIDMNPIWPIVEMIAKGRESNKRKLSSSHLWRGYKSTHEIGVAGEIIAASATGYPLIDVELHDGVGDIGYDLEYGIDVKTTSYWPPILKHPVKTRMPKWFALVYLREKDKAGCFIGMVDSATLINHGAVKKFREDAPMNYTLQAKMVNDIWEMRRDFPNFFPPISKRWVSWQMALQLTYYDDR